MSNIDLNLCIPGQKLKTRQGNTATYDFKLPLMHYYDHRIILDDSGFIESRTNDGYVYKNVSIRDPKIDEDIVEILPIEKLEKSEESEDEEN